MVNKWEKVDLIGVLATKSEVLNAMGKENIFINKGNNVQFFVKIISLPPDDYPSPDADYVSAFSTMILNNYNDDNNLPDEERIMQLEEAIKNKYFTLNVEQKNSNTFINNTFYNAKNLMIIENEDNLLTRQDILFPIPYFDSDDFEKGFEEFLYNLFKQNNMPKNNHISMEKTDLPKYILFEEKGEFKAIGPISNIKFNNDGLILENDLNINIYDFEEQDYEYFVKNNNRVIFVNRILDEKITEAMNEKNYINIEVIENIYGKFGEKNLSTSKDEGIDFNIKEREFLNHFRNVLNNQDLLYSEKDIINFHTAVKSSNLVILSGMSGTGKSRLVRAYADALNLKGQFKFISVSPGWTDESDLIGYADTMNMVYRPGDSGLINFLHDASENPNKLFLVCLDEMNLAKVEHYFAQFLSILEIDDKEDKRRLKLYNKDLGNRLYNSDHYEHEIILKNNIRFVGTVNIDDTTHHFSNKVLDRANVINLDVLPFKSLKNNSYKEKVKLKYEEFENYYVSNFIQENNGIQLDDIQIEFLEELHNILTIINRQIGIGPRVVKQIDKYIKNIPVNDGEYNESKGFDIQIAQRILTKIRGSKEELENLVGIYDITMNNVVNSKIIDLFNKYSEVSGFEESKVIIMEKAKELYFNGYAF